MTLFSIYKRYKWRISLTLGLVLAEAGAMLMLPLVIGFAIDGLLAASYVGVWQLAAVGFGVLMSGSLRRLYDTRVYSGIYVDLSTEIVENDKSSSTSTLNARVAMLKELVEFFENDFPELMNSVIGLIGTVVILYALDIEIFIGCLLVLLVMVVVFVATGTLTTKLNRHYNNAMEKQVIALERRENRPIRGYMRRLMRWNIKLSDLETRIFAVIWFAMVALIVFSVVEAVGDGALKTGAVMAIVMYVFQFADGAGMLPLFFQQFLRLREISSRLHHATDAKAKP